MGTILQTGLSNANDGTAAATEAVRQAKEKLGGGSRVGLAIVHVSSKYDYQAVVDSVRAATGCASDRLIFCWRVYRGECCDR